MLNWEIQMEVRSSMLSVGRVKLVQQWWSTMSQIRITMEKQLVAGFSERIAEDAGAVPFKPALRFISLASKLTEENEMSI
jgi:hypothetical protein